MLQRQSANSRLARERSIPVVPDMNDFQEDFSFRNVERSLFLDAFTVARWSLSTGEGAVVSLDAPGGAELASGWVPVEGGGLAPGASKITDGVIRGAALGRGVPSDSSNSASSRALEGGAWAAGCGAGRPLGAVATDDPGEAVVAPVVARWVPGTFLEDWAAFRRAVVRVSRVEDGVAGWDDGRGFGPETTVGAELCSPDGKDTTPVPG